MSAPDPELMTAAEAAAYLRVSIRTLSAWRSQGSGPPSYRPAKVVLYRRSEVDSWITSGAAVAAARQ